MGQQRINSGQNDKRLFTAMNIIAKLVGLTGVFDSGESSGLAVHSGKVYRQGMNQLSRFISLHPYFKVPPDKMPHLKAILPEFAAKTRNETGNLFYEFTINGDEVFCREGYVNAEALLAHLENVGAMLAQAMTMAELIRIEVHGPAAELAKLKEPLAHLKPAWFELHS